MAIIQSTAAELRQQAKELKDLRTNVLSQKLNRISEQLQKGQTAKD